MANQTQDILGFPLAPQQEQLFLLPAGVPATQAIVVLASAVSAVDLESALDQLVSRFEILRTTFVRRAGMRVPQQVISDALPFAWTTDGSTRELEVLLRDESAALDLERGPVLRAALATLPSSERALVLTAPAVCLDGESMTTLLDELAQLYGGNAEPEEPLQYADYAGWRRQLLDDDGPDAEEARAWWGQDDGRRAPQLLFGRPAREGEGGTHMRLQFTLSDADAAAIRGAAGRLRVADTVFLEACVHALVSRISGESELMLAGLADGRYQPDLAGAVGPFAQYVPIRSRLEPATTFAELVDQVRRARSDATRWQDYASALDLSLGPRASLGFSAYGDAVEGDLYPAGGVLSLTTSSAPLAIEFVVHSHGGRSSWELGYDPSCYDASDAERIAGCFSTVVLAAAADSDQAVAALPILDPTERAAVLALSDASTAEIPAIAVHHAFETHAAATPGTLAVTDGSEQLTYGELNAAANQLAHRLVRLGVGKGQIVALCLDRSPGAVVALLGILKSGAAFLPLNFEHPASRLAHQLEEAQVSALVTQEPLLSRLPAYAGPVVCLDRDAEELAAEPDHDLEQTAELEDLAYVMYTSGSTGLPKGVAVTHANVANYTARMLGRFDMEGENLQFAVVSALSTDLGYTSVFPPLAGGGSIHLIGPDVVIDPEAFAAYTSATPIDVLKITPSLLAALLEAESPAVLPRRWLVCGGEAFTFELLDRIRALGGGCRILNHYGPTETTIGTCVGEVVDGPIWRVATVPIGRPLENAHAYIVDPLGRPTPPGIAGELLIGGAGVARGYLNRPAETDERFVPDPFSNIPGARVYRTGDRARWLPDGTIEFLGRIDEQLKIRGFRVEPGEIEATLLRHPAVRQAAVVAHGTAEDQRLVAYVVASPQPSPEELVSFLAEWLPEYMLPSIHPIDVLPLTPSGKVDRRALPDPVTADLAAAHEYVAPRNELEQEIAGIWQELLGIDRVGVEDDFFALGGHSLLATQMITRVRRRHGNVPLRALFTAPTVAALAKVIADRPEEQ